MRHGAAVVTRQVPDIKSISPQLPLRLPLSHSCLNQIHSKMTRRTWSDSTKSRLGALPHKPIGAFCPRMSSDGGSSGGVKRSFSHDSLLFDDVPTSQLRERNEKLKSEIDALAVQYEETVKLTEEFDEVQKRNRELLELVGRLRMENADLQTAGKRVAEIERRSKGDRRAVQRTKTKMEALKGEKEALESECRALLEAARVRFKADFGCVGEVVERLKEPDVEALEWKRRLKEERTGAESLAAAKRELEKRLEAAEKRNSALEARLNERAAFGESQFQVLKREMDEREEASRRAMEKMKQKVERLEGKLEGVKGECAEQAMKLQQLRQVEAGLRRELELARDASARKEKELSAMKETLGVERGKWRERLEEIEAEKRELIDAVESEKWDRKEIVGDLRRSHEMEVARLKLEVEVQREQANSFKETLETQKHKIYELNARVQEEARLVQEKNNKISILTKIIEEKEKLAKRDMEGVQLNRLHYEDFDRDLNERIGKVFCEGMSAEAQAVAIHSVIAEYYRDIQNAQKQAADKADSEIRRIKETCQEFLVSLALALDFEPSTFETFLATKGDGLLGRTSSVMKTLDDFRRADAKQSYVVQQFRRMFHSEFSVASLRELEVKISSLEKQLHKKLKKCAQLRTKQNGSCQDDTEMEILGNTIHGLHQKVTALMAENERLRAQIQHLSAQLDQQPS